MTIMCATTNTQIAVKVLCTKTGKWRNHLPRLQLFLASLATSLIKTKLVPLKI